jgi:hypothetical protein
MAEITLDQIQPFPTAQGYSTTGTTLRVWYNRSFQDSSGTTIIGGNGSSGFYIVAPCTVTSNEITADSFQFWTTVDALDPNPQSIQCFARFYSNNTPKDWLFYGAGTPLGWIVYNPNPLTSWTFAQLQLLNQNPYLANPPQTFPTTQEMIDYVNSVIGATSYASVSHLGSVYLDVPADVSTVPRVVGSNSYASTTHSGIIKTSYAPASATAPYAWGYNDPRITYNYPGVFDANAAPYNCVPGTGVDQTANWQLVLADATAYAILHGAAIILADDGVYTISSALTQTSRFNAQLTLPFVSQTDQRAALTIQSKTDTHNPTPFRYPGAPLPTAGVIFYSTLTGQTYSGTYGKPFIMAAPDQIHGTTAAQFSYMSLRLKGVAFRAPVNPSIGGINGEMLNRLIIEDFRADTTDPNLGLLTATVPTHPTGIASLMPLNGMDGSEYRGFNEFTGWFAAAGIGELQNIAGVISATQNTVGLNIVTPFYHGSDLGHCILTRNKYGIAQVDASSGIIAPQGITNTGLTEIRGYADFENYTGGAWDTIADIYDPNSKFGGRLEYTLVSATGGGNIAGALTVNGASSLQTINLATPGTIRQSGDATIGFALSNPNAGTSAQGFVGAFSDQAQAYLQAFSLLNSQTELAGKAALGAASSNGLAIYSANNTPIQFYNNGTAAVNRRFRIHIGGVKIEPITYANLIALVGSPEFGMIAAISDSNTATWGAVIAGGGTNPVIGLYTTAWHVMGA